MLRRKPLSFLLEYAWYRGSVVRLILLRGVALATAGLAAGTVLAAAATRLLSTLLFGVTPSDPATFVSAVLTLLAVAVVATLIPAWRASGVDPLLSLRKD